MVRFSLQTLAAAASACLLMGGTVADEQSPNRPANFDRFNYDTTIQANDHNDFGPEDWGRVRCPDTDVCLGWPDAWEEAIGWSLRENSCRWCPQGRGCGTHHQSPINVYREVVLESDRLHNVCIDGHMMIFFDGTCSFEQLVEYNAFSIERHTLKITQPTERMENGQFRLACWDPAVGRRFPRLDYAKGFSDWWHLSHIDLKLPSEHTQNGRRYDGEMQMYQFYSVSGQQAGVNNEMGTVSVFLQSFDNTPDYPMLNRVICQWRRVEEETRAACGLPSVTTDYPGCRVFNRGSEASTTSVGPGRNLRTSDNEEFTNTTRPAKPMSVHDIIMHNFLNPDNQKVLIMDDDDFRDADDLDWGEFVKEQEENERQNYKRRHLMNYNHVGPFHNYWPLIGCQTEYYYRYGGTQTVPPCYGRFTQGANRGNTNHWRVMKDPLRISKRQLAELHRLLRERIAPPDDPLVACQADTAAKVDEETGLVNVARPVMENNRAHHMVFCECPNWGSQWQADKDWCRIHRDDRNARLFQHPYNFFTEGF